MQTNWGENQAELVECADPIKFKEFMLPSGRFILEFEFS